MKSINISKLLFCLVCIFLSISACTNSNEVEDDNIIPAAKCDTISVSKSTGVPIRNIGVQFDPLFFTQNVTRNDGSKEADWDNIIVPRIKKMKMQHFRVMLLPYWWEPINDNDNPNIADMSKFTFDSQEMQGLYKLLNVAQDNQIGVTLVLWGCPTNMNLLSGLYNGQRHFLCDARSQSVNPGWIAGTDKYQEFAESFSTLTKHLIETKGYTCIEEITPFNEPDSHIANYGRLMWQGDYESMGWADTYAPMVKALDAKFKSDGIRNKVKFNLSDNTEGSFGYLSSCVSTFTNGEADLYNSHKYGLGYEASNKDFVGWENQNVKICGSKQHYVGEFGFPGYGSARQYGIDTYQRGVQLVRAAINYLNAGACGVSYWSLLDQYMLRYDSYDSMQQLGLWKYVKEAYAQDKDVYDKINSDYEVRPQYYAYSLLTRFIRPGDEVYPLSFDNELMAGAGFLNTAGKWTYVLVNGIADVDKTIHINNAKNNSNGSYAVYKYLEGRLPKDDSMIESTETITSDKTGIHLKVTRNAIYVLVQL